jgi:hypothetical protein
LEQIELTVYVGGGMKIFRGEFLLAIALLMASIITSASVSAQPLTSFDFNIVGLQLKADPEYQAVPKGIATQVNTFFEAGEVDLCAILDKLPQDYTVRAELYGPAFQTPLTLVTRPGQPFDIPTLALLGKYTLSNIRLVNNGGNILFGAVPQAVTIESIDAPLISEVTTRPLTIEELQERGVTFDSSNFDAYEFTAAIGTESGRVPFNLPVLIPSGDQMYQADEMPPPPGLGALSQPPETILTPQPGLPENISLSGFLMEVAEVEPGEEQYVGELPPIPGILVIPGNIGFLHQYFSALSIVSNGAPEQSNLVVTNVQVKLIMPIGADLTAGTDTAPGDDPLRMAKGADGFFPRELPVLHPGADGTFGNSDDINQLYPAESGQADFTIEGLKEGTHSLDFEITGILEGLPIGPIELKGYATGAVLVRNPDFSVTMAHPATVRSGEPYDLFVTITNTGKSIANLVSLRLDPRAISGAVFTGDETPDKQIDTIVPGASATIKYRLISQRTGKVTATAFASEDVDGRFILRTGVGENEIPLSPDSLILPYTGNLPSDLINSVVGLLGQAWSVATAPSGVLPSDVLPIAKQVIVDKANNLSEAGLRLLLGDSDARAIGDLTFDLLGSDEGNNAFDSLRRSSNQGRLVNAALADVLQIEVESSGLLTTQAKLSDLATYREAHLSLAVSDASVHLQLTDSSGKRTGGLSPGNDYREIAYADRLLLTDNNTSRSAILLATRIESDNYTATLKADADAVFDFGVVLPDSSGTLQQLRFIAVNLPTNGIATVVLYPGTDAVYSLNIDHNGDGVIDKTVAASSTIALFDRTPEVVAATQIVPGFGPGGDEHGRTVAVLFSERVDKESAENVANYLVEKNRVRAAYLQPGGRMAFILLDEGIGPFFERTIAVENILDNAGTSMQAVSRPITITAEGPAAKLKGAIRLADGTPVPNATVRLLQPEKVEIFYSLELRYFIITEKTTDADGNYSFDYVLRDNDGPFMLQALNPQTNEMANLTTGVIYHDQEIILDLFMKARGNVTGTVYDADDNPVANASVLLTTMADKRSYAVAADASGQYAFIGVNVGPFSIKANSQTLFAEGNTMGILPDEGGSVVQDIHIYRLDGIDRGDVAGKVTDADGTPRAGIVVIVEVFEGYRKTYSNWMYSGADGSFSFTGVHAKEIVRVRVRDDATGETGQINSRLLPGETAYFNVILQGIAGIEGLIRREDQLSSEGMVVAASFGSRTLYATVDATDHFVFTDLPVGTVALRLLNPESYALTLAAQSITLLRAGDIQYAELFVPISATVNGTITGTVFRLDGSIAAGAEVRLINFAKGTYLLFTADGSGRFEIPDLNSGRYPLVVINGREICNQTVEIFYDRQVKDVDLRPFGFANINGTVYDEGSGMMPVGADVSLLGMQPDEFGWLRYKNNPIATTKSDPQTGYYIFRDIYQGDYSIRASNIFRPTPAVHSGTIVEDGESITTDLILKDTFGSVSGQVLLSDGTPAGADIRVSLMFGGAVVAVMTDETGLFAFEPIIPAGRYMVTAEDLTTTLLGQSGTIVSVGADTVITIRLLGRGTLRVLAQNADGSVEGSANVSLRGAGFPYDTAIGTTDVDGVVTLYNLSEGNYAINATGSASRGGRANTIISNDGEIVNATVTLASYGQVTGTFFKTDRVTPVPGGQMTLKVANQPIGYAISSADPATLGQFTIDYVPLGAFSLEGFDPVSDRLGRGAGQLDNHGDTVSANVVVVVRGTVKGSVLNYSGTSPVGRATVNLSSNSTHSFSYTLTAAPDGTFQFAGVPEGQFTINVTDPETGLRGQAQGTINFEGETRQVEVRVAASGSIDGVVHMPDGSLASSVSVSMNNGNKTTVNPADGSFHFTDLAVGTTYTLFAQENGTNRAAKTLVYLSDDGAVARPEIILAGIGTVEGTVVDPGGANLPGAKVSLYAQGAVSVSYTLNSDANGLFRFIGVPVSSFSLNASYPGLLTGAAANGLLHNEGDVVVVSMQFGDIASVKGKVMLPDTTTPANGGVARFRSENNSVNAVIDSDGYFTFNNIPLCSFVITFEDPTGTAIGTVSGEMTVNGEIIDVGTIILDDKPITVVGVTPADGTINLPVGTEIIHIKFSEPAKISTLNATNVKLFSGANQINATVQPDADGFGVQLLLNQSLTGYALYTVVISGVQDMTGWTMAETFTSTFTTMDNIPPTIVSLSPQSGTIQVSLDAVVRVTFSEPINTDTLAGLRLLQGGFTVESQLDLIQSNTVAILTPVNPLQSNLTYTFEGRGVEDTAGNVLVGATLSQFNSLDTLAPAVISLTANADAVLIEGLLVKLTAEVAATDVDRVDFYQDNLLLATDNEAPFTASVQLPASGVNHFKAIAEDNVGNRGPSTLLNLDVAADQSPTVLIEAPVDGTTVANGESITVKVKAQDDVSLTEISLNASGSTVLNQVNIVAGIEQSALFELVVPDDALPGSEIMLTASAMDLVGQTSNSEPVRLSTSDETMPIISLFNPDESDLFIPGSTGVLAITATDNVNIAEISCSISGAVKLHNIWSFDSNETTVDLEFTFTIPEDAVAYSDINIDCSANDSSGNSTLTSLHFQVADVVPPSIISTSIMDGAVEVSLDARVIVTFDEPLSEETVGSTTVQLSVDDEFGQMVPGNVYLSPNNQVVTFIPFFELTGNVDYKLTLTNILADVAGNSIGQDYVIHFRTSLTDTTPPAIVTVTPGDGASDVTTDTTIVVMFSEPMAEWSFSKFNPANGYSMSRFTLESEDGEIDGWVSLSADGLTVKFSPKSQLEYAKLYTFKISAGLADEAYNRTEDDFQLSFQTVRKKEIVADLKVVYHDPTYQTSWISRIEADLYHNYLVANGFISLNATRLAQFMTENGPESLVVMAQDVVPDTVAKTMIDPLIRQYMNRGGVVIWNRDTPFAHIGQLNTPWIEWGVNALQDVLEVEPGVWDLNETTQLTVDANALGLTNRWSSNRAVLADSVTSVLATDSLGQAAGWFKNFNPDYPLSGFYRLWGDNISFDDWYRFKDLMTITGTDIIDLVDDSLVASYHADGNWYDATFNHYDGLPLGSGFSYDSLTGYAAGDFRPVGAGVEIGNMGWRLYPDDFTMEAWVKMSGSGNGFGRIVTGSSGGGADFGIGLYNGQFVSFSGNGISTIYASSGITPNIGEWYHVTGTSDGRVLRLYVNGELADSIDDDLYYPFDDNNFWIGNLQSCPEWVFSGLIDEVTLYDRPLTAIQVADQYQAGLTFNGAAPTEPVVITVELQSPGEAIRITGTKDVDAAILADGVEFVPIDGVNNWVAIYEPKPGATVVRISSRNASGLESSAVDVSLLLIE